ncbi:ABC transporter substrate-binding protein [Pararhodobacter oceanensis]|uniref:ABC transporter substrate-binding protein n=1 Tax=Pararhodobacter oceanensis TaxID=2172121 RepID=UPI003A922521
MTRPTKISMIAALLMGATVVNDAEAETVRIGFPVPLTGVVAESARDMVNGFQLYLDQHDGMLGGLEVELFIEDTEAIPQNALTKARKLVESDNVDFIVGFFLASEGLAVRDYAEENEIPLFLPIVSADDITQRMRSPYIVRMIWTSSQVMHPFGEYAYNELGYERIAVVGVDYAFGWETVGGFQTTFEEAGGEIVSKIWLPFDTSDYGSFAAQIPRDVDAVFSVLVGAHIPGFLRAYQDYGLQGSIPLIGANVLTDEDVLRSMGDEALGVVTAHSYTASLERPQNIAFVEAFNEEYGHNPSYYAEATYTAAMWIDRALAETGMPTDPLALVEAVRAVELLDAPRGPLRLDEYGNPIETIYIRETVVAEDGEGMENQVLHSIPEVSQFWTYSPEEFLSQPVYSRNYPPLQ